MILDSQKDEEGCRLKSKKTYHQKITHNHSNVKRITEARDKHHFSCSFDINLDN